LKFTIISLPTMGVLKSGGVAVTVGQRFTGSPTNLTYEPGGACDFGGVNVNDGFAFAVTDTGSGTLPAQTANGTVSITVTPAVAAGAVELDASGILRIGGTSDKDEIHVEQASGGKQLKVKIKSQPDLTLQAANVSEVRIWGRGGNDHLHLKVEIPAAYIHGGAGDDDIISDKDAATIEIGGAGKDDLSATGPGSLMAGGAGSDHVEGQGKENASKDILIGGDVGCGLSLADLRAAAAGWMASGPAFATSSAGLALVAAVVDTEKDNLDGHAGSDWYIANPKKTDDTHVDTKKGDFLTLV
jgi:hypothetical protein